MRFVHFADDTTVFASDSDINNVHDTVNRELAELCALVNKPSGASAGASDLKY